MLIKIIIIGATEKGAISDLLEDYVSRVKHYSRTEIKYLSLSKKKKTSASDLQKQNEGDLILAEVGKNSFLILLDEKGKEFTSVGFSNFLQKKLLAGGSEIIFCIGGAYGFSEEVYQRANQKIALSQMTFTHQMVRVVFMEQLYRAFTILKGEKYHH